EEAPVAVGVLEAAVEGGQQRPAVRVRDLTATRGPPAGRLLDPRVERHPRPAMVEPREPGDDPWVAGVRPIAGDQDGRFGRPGELRARRPPRALPRQPRRD